MLIITAPQASHSTAAARDDRACYYDNRDDRGSGDDRWGGRGRNDGYYDASGGQSGALFGELISHVNMRVNNFSASASTVI